MKNKPIIKETWDYNPPNGSKFQDDWNQTIVTMFNHIHQTYHNDEEMIFIDSPKKFKLIFNSISINLSKIFYIRLSDMVGNYMYVGDVQLEILNFVEPNNLGETIYNKINREKREPEYDEVLKYIEETGNRHSFYSAREELRNLVYGGHIGAKPPNGFQSWGDYWKSY